MVHYNGAEKSTEDFAVHCSFCRGSLSVTDLLQAHLEMIVL